MKVNRRLLAEIIGEKTLHESDGRQLARSVAAYLIAEKYTGNLASLMRDVMRYRQARGIVEGTAVSAHGLNETVVGDIVKMLHEEFPSAKQVLVREKTDASVIGGVRIDLPDEQLDMTVKAKLNTLRRLTA